MAASVTHKAKTGPLLTGTEYEAADAHNVTIAAADVGAAPSDVDYLVGTASAGLSAEIAVGTTPGGELGNTWASPTVDASHSGSTHAATQAAAEATASGALTTHAGAADPHTGYQKESEKDAANGYAGLSASSLVADAQIPLTNGAPSTQAMGDAASVGTGTRAARSDHKHAMPALGTTAAAVGTSAGGSAVTPSKSDHVHATGAGTPSTQAMGDAAAIGTGPAAAMTDHKHAMPALGTTAAAIGTSAGGSAVTPSKSDHVHATGAGTPSTQAFADAAAVGTGPAASMTDHKHAMPTLGFGLSGNSAPAVGLSQTSGFVSTAVTVSAATYADLTGASVSLVAGTWLIMAQVFGSAVNLAFLMHVAITDGANAIVSEGSSFVPASGTASVHAWTNLTLHAIVAPGSTTTYKLRGARGLTTLTNTWTAQDGAGVNVSNNASSNTDKGTGIFAVRIA